MFYACGKQQVDLGFRTTLSGCSNDVKGICPSPSLCSAFQPFRKHSLSTYFVLGTAPFSLWVSFSGNNKDGHEKLQAFILPAQQLWERKGSSRSLTADPPWHRSGPLPISEPITVTLVGWAGSHAYPCCQGVWSAPLNHKDWEWRREALQREVEQTGTTDAYYSFRASTSPFVELCGF